MGAGLQAGTLHFILCPFCFLCSLKSECSPLCWFPSYTCPIPSSLAVAAADLEPGSPLEVHELPSDEEGDGAADDADDDSDDDADLDSHLAAAILAVEASAKQQRGGGSKFRLPKAFSLPGGGGAQQQQRPASAGGEGGYLPSPGSEASSAAGLHRQRHDLDSSGGPASPDSPSLAAAADLPLPSPSTSAAATALQQHLQQQQRGAAPPSAQQRQHQHLLLSEADYVDYPYLVDGEPCPAAYLLLCCANYLRVYPTSERAREGRPCCRPCCPLQLFLGSGVHPFSLTSYSVL